MKSRCVVETILGKRGISIAASAIVFPLRAAARSSHFEHFARRDGGWSAQSSCLWASNGKDLRGCAALASVLVAVVEIRHVRMVVGDRRVLVGVAMGLGGIRAGWVRVLMVRIVDV